ncbi:hypothetical protein WAF17_00875 [Bernardetia sp. ABR2-2B]|uniref:hypothetical protein n=1 Tax=Bernardetia sp. ABR2-2B TaxID=3127472 RepID=UPI0030CDB821
MNQPTNNSETISEKVVAINSERELKEQNKKVRILSLGFVFSVFIAFFLLLSFSSKAQNADKNKYLATFQDKTYIGLATEDNVELIYTQCGDPISTFYFDVSNGEPMFVMAGLYDIMMYQLTSVKKENDKFVLTYKDAKGQKQVAQLETESNNEKIYVIFEGMKMGFAVKEKMNIYKISNDCDEMRLATPNKK